MTAEAVHSIVIIAVVSIITIILRAIPFLLFDKKRVPSFIVYLGRVLPPAIIAILVIYCVKNIDLLNLSSGIPEFISIGVVALLHSWKHNTLLSIGMGTICYMILIHLIA